MHTVKNVQDVAKSNKEIEELLKEQKMTEAECDEYKTEIRRLEDEIDKLRGEIDSLKGGKGISAGTDKTQRTLEKIENRLKKATALAIL